MGQRPMCTISQPKELAEMSKPTRRFYTEVPGPDWLRLESIAMDNGTTGYRLAGQVISDWIHGRLIPATTPTNGGADGACPSPSPSVAGQ